MSQTILPVGHEELGAKDCEVDADEGGYVELSCWVGNKLEESVPWVFKVTEPVGPRLHTRLRSRVFYCFGDDLGLYGSKHVL